MPPPQAFVRTGRAARLRTIERQRKRALRPRLFTIRLRRKRDPHHSPVLGRHPEERLWRRRIRLRSASPSPTVQASNRFWPSSRGASFATKDLSSISLSRHTLHSLRSRFTLASAGGAA